MNKIYGLFVILGVLGEFAFCQQLIQVPYEYQNIDLSRTLFESLFDTLIPIEARNETPTTAKPASSTSGDVLIVPIYEEPIYEPFYYEIPPYPILYNAPTQDPRLLFDNFEPNYSLINRLLSIYPQIGIQSLPSSNPSLISGAQENMISQPIDSNAIPKPTNKNPSIGIQSLPFFNPSSINAASEKTISQYNGSKAIPKPATVDSSISTSPLLNGIISNVEMTNDDLNTLSKKIEKVIADFLTKKLQKMEETFDNGQTNFKTLAPWSSTFVTPVSTYGSGIPVVENIIEEYKQSNQTNKLNIVDIGDRIPLGDNLIFRPGSFLNYKPLQVNGTMPNSTEMNQFDNTTASQNGTDDSRKMDFDTVEKDNDESVDIRQKLSIIVPTDKSSTTYSEDLIKRSDYYQTSVNSSKLNDRIMDQIPEFINVDGKNCSLRMSTYQGENHLIIICAEESFDGKTERKTTYKSNVTFYTGELPTTTKSTTQLIEEINKNSSKSFEYEVNPVPLNIESKNTTKKSTTQLNKDNMVLNETMTTDSRPIEYKKIVSTTSTINKSTKRFTTENPLLYEGLAKTYSKSPPFHSIEDETVQPSLAF